MVDQIGDGGGDSGASSVKKIFRDGASEVIPVDLWLAVKARFDKVRGL
jgi:hypothetical protein